MKVAVLAERSRETQARIDQMRSMQQPEAHNDEMEMSEPWSSLLYREGEMVLQPPELLVPASEEIEADHDFGR